MASNAIGRLVVEIGADIADFKAKMSEVQDQADASAKALEESYKRLGVAMVAVGAAVTGFAMFAVKGFMETGDQLDKMSKRTGFTVETLSALMYVTQRAGTSIEGLEVGVRRLQRALLDANDGMVEYQRAFKTLGIDYEQLAKASPEEQFMAVMNALAGVSDASKRAALAQELLGRSGTSLIPIISDGTGKFKELMGVAKELGTVMSKEDAEAAADLKDAMTSMKASTQGLMREIGQGLAPTIESLANKMAQLTAVFNKWASANPVLAKTITQVVVALGALLLVGGTILILLPHLTAALATLGISIHLLLGPIGWVALAVTALAAAFLYLANSADAANRKRIAAEKEVMEEKKRLLAEELADMEAAYEEEVELIQDSRDAKLAALEKEQSIAQIYYNWKLSQLEATRDAALEALDSEKAIAERYYNWQMGKLNDLREAAIEKARVELEAAQKAYDLQRKAVQEYANSEIESISRIRDERLAALQEQLDAMDRLAIVDQRDQIEARKREIEAQLEVVQTEEKRQELLAEYASLNQDLANIDRQEKRSALQEEMDNIRIAAEADIRASQDRMAAAIEALDATLQTAITNAAAASDQANSDYEIAQANLETLISTSLAGTEAETALITAKWAEEMKGQLDFQTQWQLDYDSRVEQIETEYAGAQEDLEKLIATGLTGTADEIAAITAKWDEEMRGNLDFQTQWQLDHQARIDGINDEATAALTIADALNVAAVAANKLQQEFLMYPEPIGPGLTEVTGGKKPGGGSFWDKITSILPSFQHGGIVMQPMMAMVGETPEAIIPLDKMRASSFNTLAVHIHAGIFMGTQQEAERVGEILNPILRRQMRANTGDALW